MRPHLQPPSSFFSGCNWQDWSCSRDRRALLNLVHPFASSGRHDIAANDHSWPRTLTPAVIGTLDEPLPSLFQSRPSNPDVTHQNTSLKWRGTGEWEPSRSLKILRPTTLIRMNRYHRITKRHLETPGLNRIQNRNLN
jgi:hypothetical protein